MIEILVIGLILTRKFVLIDSVTAIGGAISRSDADVEINDSHSCVHE